MSTPTKKAGWAASLVALAGFTALAVCSNHNKKAIVKIPTPKKIETMFREAQWHLNGGVKAAQTQHYYAAQTQNYRR
jgi:hypothetical protein